MIKIGTCGFTYKHFKYFDVLEVQQTFYDIVSDSQLQKWRKMAEENHVELTIKALQVITHEYNTTTYKRMKNKFGDVRNYGFFKNTKEIEEATEITLNEAKALNAKLIIFQTPASFKPTEENAKLIIDYFSTLSKSFKYCWEPRGDWYNKIDLLKKVLETVNLIHVVDPFKHEALTSERYFRLHGIGKGEVNYSYKYTDDDLRNLKSKIKDGDYILFNNIYSFEDALRFKEMIKKP